VKSGQHALASLAIIAEGSEVKVAAGQGYSCGYTFNEVFHQNITSYELTTGTLPPFGVVVEPEFLSLSAQCVAVNPQGLGGLGHVAVVFFEQALDKTPLEFADSLRELDSVIDHAVDEGF
jgi:hypothetical protein